MGEICIYKQITAEIAGQIADGTIQPGGKIPSVKTIQDRYKVGHVTALRVLKELSLDNYVMFERGKGYFACDKRAVTPHRKKSHVHGLVACLTRPSWATNESDNYFNEINQALENRLMGKAFSSLRPWCARFLLNQHPTGEVQDQIRRKILELDDSVDGFLLDERISDRVVSDLSGKVTKPLVVVNRSTRTGVDSVSPDNAGAARQVAAMCLKMGYELFLVGRSFPIETNTTERTEGFVTALIEARVPAKDIIRFDFSLLPYEREIIPLEDHLATPRKTLLFAPSSGFAVWAAQTLAARSLKIGERLGIVGFATAGFLLNGQNPKPTMVDVGPAAIGTLAVDVLMGRIHKTLTSIPSNHSPDPLIKMGGTL